jgi:hypothetical protein
VLGMPESYEDPAGNTQAFRAFVERHETAQEATPATSRLPVYIGVAAAAVLVIALVAWLALG